MFVVEVTVCSVYWAYVITNENFPSDPPVAESEGAVPALAATEDYLAVGTWSDEETVRVRVEMGDDLENVDAAAWETADQVRWSVTGPVTITQTDFYPALPAGTIPTEPGEYDVKLWARRRGFSSSLDEADVADFAEEHLIQLRPRR